MHTLVDFAPIFSNILRVSTDRVRIVDGARALEDVIYEHRRIVFALNHGPAHLPIIPMAALCQTLLERGGGHRTPVGITFRGMYLVPVFRRFVRYLTQVASPPTFDELVLGFARYTWDSVMVMPEGANSAFGDPLTIRPFASPRFVELATRFDAPIVLAVHTGLEGYAREFAAPSALLDVPWLQAAPYGLGRALSRARSFAVPTSARRLPELRMSFAVHHPSRTSQEFDAMDDADRRAWVRAEAEEVHARMVALHRATAEAPGASAPRGEGARDA